MNFSSDYFTGMKVINCFSFGHANTDLVFYVESPLLQDFGCTMEVCNGKLPVLVFNFSRILELYVYSDCNKNRVNSQYCIVNTFVVLLI